MKKAIVLIAAVILMGAGGSKASHIFGGEISVQWKNVDTFHVTLNFYRDCNPGSSGFPGSRIILGIYDRLTHISLKCDTLIFDSAATTIIPIGDTCFQPVGLCVERGVYKNDLVLPANSHGYYLTYSTSARSAQIVNIQDPGSTGSTWYTQIPDPALHNSSPAFKKFPRSYFCVNYPNTDTVSATDADGDSLVYTLVTPYDTHYQWCPDPAPYPLVAWMLPYSGFNMIGGNPAMAIDKNTGVLTANPPNLGVFVFCVRIQEWQRGPNPVKLGEVRRDMQYSVLDCHTTKPVFTNANLVLSHTDTLKAGDTLDLQVQIKDTSIAFLTLVAQSVLFTNGSKAIFQQPVSGFGTAVSEFRYIPACLDTGVHRVTFMALKKSCYKMDTLTYDVDITVLPADPPSFSSPLSFTVQKADSVIAKDIIAGSSVTLDAGDNLSGQVKVSVANPENTLILSGQSELFGAGATFNNVSGFSSVQSDFNFTSSCKNIRDNPYHMKLTAEQCYQQSLFEFDVLVKPPVFDTVPNIFTPNGDGKNDYFQLKRDPPLKYDCGFNIKIFNRWGELMYEHAEPNFKWDGTGKAGSKAAEGIYYYIIEGFIGASEYKRRGTIYLKL